MKNSAAIIARLNRELEQRGSDMDLTNLEEKAREAKLDYGEAESLARFLNFQRERRGEPPISADYGQLCDHLSEIYPDVEFNLAGHRIVARVKSGVSGSLIDRIGFINSHIPHLSATIGFGSDSFEVVFRADGIGVIKEDSWYEFFEHDLNLEEVRRDCENDTDALNEFLQDHFNEHIGPQMEDPFFDPSGEDCELYFETGSKDEFERLMRLFILTEPDVEAHEDEEVRLYAAMEETEPRLERSDGYFSERLEALAEIALSENRPVGWTWEYNDGAYNRRSGYDVFAESLTWNIGEILEQAPAREKMAARRDLRKWLEERGHDMARFDALAKGKDAT
ncbi:MAG TPA: hypothetical protein VFV58_20500 [Blastocatellia bacterium]|jgi:hypothetical protein|nr:hypothetical protein [Blastocatellia bacterium]